MRRDCSCEIWCCGFDVLPRQTRYFPCAPTDGPSSAPPSHAHSPQQREGAWAFGLINACARARGREEGVCFFSNTTAVPGGSRSRMKAPIANGSFIASVPADVLPARSLPPSLFPGPVDIGHGCPLLAYATSAEGASVQDHPAQRDGRTIRNVPSLHLGAIIPGNSTCAFAIGLWRRVASV